MFDHRVTRKPRPKRTSRRGRRSSDNNSTCQEEDGTTGPSKKSMRSGTASEPHPSKMTSQKIPDSVMPSSIDMESSLMSRSVSDYDLKPAINSMQNEIHPSASFSVQSHKDVLKNETHQSANRPADRDSYNRKKSSHTWGKESNSYGQLGKWGDGSTDPSQAVHISGCSYNLLDNLPNLLTVEKVFQFENKIEENINEPLEKVSCGHQRHISDVSVGERKLNCDSEGQIDKGNINYSHCCENDGSNKESLKVKLCAGFIENSAINGVKGGVDNDEWWQMSDCMQTPKIHESNREPVDDIICDHNNLDKRMHSFNTPEKSLTNEDAFSDLDKNNQAGIYTRTYQMATENPLAVRNRIHCHCETPKGHSSFTDNPSSSDFELIDHNVVHEKSISDISNVAALPINEAVSTSSQAHTGHQTSQLGHPDVMDVSSTPTLSSSSCELLQTDLIPSSASPTGQTGHHQQQNQRHHIHYLNTISQNHNFIELFTIHGGLDDEKNDLAEESLEQVNFSEGERQTDDLSNYNPSDSDDVDTDGSHNEVPRGFEEKWKRLRFKEQASESECKY